MMKISAKEFTGSLEQIRKRIDFKESLKRTLKDIDLALQIYHCMGKTVNFREPEKIACAHLRFGRASISALKRLCSHNLIVLSLAQNDLLQEMSQYTADLLTHINTNLSP